MPASDLPSSCARVCLDRLVALTGPCVASRPPAVITSPPTRGVSQVGDAVADSGRV